MKKKIQELPKLPLGLPEFIGTNDEKIYHMQQTIQDIWKKLQEIIDYINHE